MQQLKRFIFVGVINTAFGYAIYAALLYAGLHFSLAALISTAAGVAFNFFTIGRIVFYSSQNKLFFRFISVYVITYVINIIALKIIGRSGVNMYVAGLITLIPMALISFLLNKKFVFVKCEN